ncbi:amidase signature domain-containing protein [Schizophyllum commune]
MTDPDQSLRIFTSVPIESEEQRRKLAELERKIFDRRERQAASIPKDWLLSSPPPAEQLNVIDSPRVCGLLNEQELEITETDDVSLILKNLHTGVWSAVDVTTAFCKRAIVAHQLTNCLTEIWIEDALKRARELDDIFAKQGPVGPLHGLPISLKDQFDVAGKECTMGIASWLGRISEEDAALVTVLKSAGAIPYVRTNVPQTLMRGETDNWVFGLTTNPHNRNLAAGGSSGGEGALIALKGSPLGVGTDIGGSIRIPSAFCGLYGVRPTMRRLPYYGASNTYLGQEAVESSLGPMSRSLAGLVEFVKAVTNGNPSDVDPKVVEMPWREELYQLKRIGGRGTKLCFAYYDNDEVVKPHPPVRRAIQITVDALRKAGHTVIRWEPYQHGYAYDTLSRIFNSDYGEDFDRIMSEAGEPLWPGVPYRAYPPITVWEAWQLSREKEAFRKKILDKWIATKELTGTGRPIDALLCPAAPSAAPPHAQFEYVGAVSGLLGWLRDAAIYVYGLHVVLQLRGPAAIIPVTRVDPELDAKDQEYTPKSELEAKVYGMYSPETFRDAPVCVQLAGRRFREEELLGICEIVDEALKVHGSG